VAAALDEMGDQRSREKAGAMRLLLEREPADEALWQGLLEALGYGGDRQSLRALGQRLPWRSLSAAMRQLPARQRLQEARRLLLEQVSLPAGRAAGRARPGNEAWRRLEGAARLAVRFCDKGLADGLAAVLSGETREGAARAVAALSVADAGRAPWANSPSETSESARRTGRGFIGRGRALEMIVNVVLPYFAASGDARRAARAGILYGRLPRPAAYGSVRHLDQALAGAVPVDARRQQGMLYLLRRYCTQGGCGKCPLS